MNIEFDRLPRVIALPPRDAGPVRGGSLPPNEIRSVGDLPERMFFGDLDEGACHFDSVGAWRAHYQGLRNSHVDLHFDGKALRIDQCFLGATMFSVCHRPTLAACTQIIGIGGQGHLDAALESWIDKRMNIRVLRAADNQMSMWCFPDGPIRDLWLPVPVARMRDLAELHRSLQGHTEIGASVRGAFTLGLSVVNFVEGRNPPEYSFPGWLFIAAHEELGLPPIEWPVRDQAKDGSAAWTVRRLHYFYRVTAFLRDMPSLIELLGEGGFIGRKGEGNAIRWPYAPEYAAVVMPSEMAVAMESVAWMDEAGARRVFIPRSDDGLQVLLEPFSDEVLEESLDTVEDAGAKSLVVLEEAADDL